MGLSNALFSSVTGLNTASTAISVIGDNIANVSTPGFKERRAEFADVLGQTISSSGGFSQIGAGSKTARVSTLFAQGTFEDTGRPTDLAVEGRGFFVLDSSQGRFYSRAGIFGFDENGFLTNVEGLRVQGFGVDPITGTSNGQLGDLQLNTAVSPPKASENLSLSLNLDSAQAVPTGGAIFDPANAGATSNFRSVVSVFDSLGNAHSVTTYYTRQAAANTWNFTVTLPGANPGDDPIVQNGGGVPTGTLTFNTDGLLDTVSSGLPTTASLAFPGGVTAGSLDINFGPALTTLGGTGAATTQYATQSTMNSFSQDGFAAGALQSLTIDREGFLSGQFSNGETVNLGQVALANFPNIEGLTGVGNNNLVESRLSGQPIVGGPQSGNFGSVRSSALEQSSVDLAAQFVRMIISQRAFQANTRTISITNELLANLVNLGN